MTAGLAPRRHDPKLGASPSSKCFKNRYFNLFLLRSVGGQPPRTLAMRARRPPHTHTLAHLHIHVHGVSNASLGRCKACPSTVVSRPKNGTLKALSGARNTDTKVARVGRLRPKHICGARPVGPQTGRASRAPLDSGCSPKGGACRGVGAPKKRLSVRLGGARRRHTKVARVGRLRPKHTSPV